MQATELEKKVVKLEALEKMLRIESNHLAMSIRMAQVWIVKIKGEL